MKSKILLALIMCLAFTAKLSAQCYAHISYYQTPNATDVTFYADSVVGGGAFGSTVFTWSFGDGTAGSGQQTNHTYSLGGVSSRLFIVCLTMTDTSTGGCTYTTCDTITITASNTPPCTTSISYTHIDSLYSFATTNSGTAPFSYVWTVNGNMVSTSSNPSAVLIDSAFGASNAVCVTVTDSAGCIASNCAYIIDSTSGQNQYSCSSYLTYSFIDSLYMFSFSHIGGTAVSYTWTYNNSIISTSDTIVYVLDSTALAAGGTMCVTVVDANGCSSTDCITLRGNPGGGGGGCQAYFQILPDSANSLSGYYVGYNMSTGSYGSNVLWNFGDGSTSTNPYPTHTYATPGQYIVCLTVGVGGTTCYDTYCDSSFYAFKTNPGLMSHLAFAAPAGIAETSADAAIRVYPNPVNNVLKINTDRKIESAKVYNIEGQLVLSTKANANEVYVSSLTSGIYILEVCYEGLTSRTKFVKE